MRTIWVGLALVGCTNKADLERATDPDLLVAFIGDQGYGIPAYAVLSLIRDEGADLVIHAGDFDYGDDPDAWDAQIDGVLGEDYPYFAAVGNHDVVAWPGYQEKLEERLARVDGAECSGIMGTETVCHYRGLTFLLSGAGTLPGGDEDWLRTQLELDDRIWSVCVWHKNQNDMQAGEKGDEVGWGPYQACQDGGGIIATGHEHSYSRTLTLTDLGNEPGGHGATGTFEVMEVEEGRTFAFVSGIAGASLRDYDEELHDDDTWWSTIYASDHHLLNGVVQEEVDFTYGALFVRFTADGKPRRAVGYGKNVNGGVFDEFEVVSGL